MASTEMPPPPVSGVVRNGGGAGAGGASKLNPSQVNFFRISTVIDQLSLHAQGQVGTDAREFLSLCLSLSRGIDFAIANQEVANRAQELPSLLKQVYQHNKNDSRLQAAIMVLMVSVKNACQCGWFSDNDSTELMNVFKEIASIFCNVPDFNTDPSSSVSIISTIMSRFFPRMKMGHIFVFLEAKPGYEAYVIDFQIAKNLRSSPGEKIRFFVVQTDNIETSSCLISPPKVSFLLNGKGVDLRTTVNMDTGPQIPTVVKPLLKYGANLLQAVGDFNGNYMIAVALMSDVSGPDGSDLQDYEQHASAIVDSDAEIIEGPSRVSLNCPISKKRFKTPVKGYSCKHIQCFDFDNYVDINSRRPNWRCAHCNQPVCFTDIRIDQKMVKILKEVGPQVTDIVFSSDGSWNTAMEIDDATKKPEDKNCSSGENSSTQLQDVSLLDAPSEDNILDLTETDDLLDDFVTHEPEERKHNPTASQSQFVIPNMAAANPHGVANTSNVNHIRPSAGDESWSRIFLSTFGPGSSSGQSQALTNYVAPPSLPDAMTSAPHEAFHGNSLVTTSVPQSEISSPNALQLQQYQYCGNPAVTNEYGRFPSQQPRNVTRVPNGVQALPVPSRASLLQQQRSRYQGSNFYVQGSMPTVSLAPSVSPMITNSTVRTHPNQIAPHMASSQMNTPWLQQQSVGHQQATNHSAYAYNRTLHERMANNRMPPHQMSQSPANIRMPSQPMSQSPGSMQIAGSFSRAPQSYVHPTDPVSGQHSQAVAANRVALVSVDGTQSIAVDPSQNASAYSMNNSDGRRMPVQDHRVNARATSQPPPRIDPYEPDPNWRPAGRMRGALTGQDYTNALNQFIIRPNQQAQAQAARPMPNPTNFTTTAIPPSRPPGMH